jgi:hypothetical protein
MYLWKLARHPHITVDIDMTRTVVVAASTESQARAVAATVAGEEGRAAWEDQNVTACIHIGDAEPTVFPYPAVVCVDTLEG